MDLVKTLAYIAIIAFLIVFWGTLAVVVITQLIK